jgi:ATP-dependent DNA helicase RecG
MPFWILNELSLPGKKDALQKLHAPECIAQAKEAAAYFKIREFLTFRLTLDRLGGKSRSAEPLKAPDLDAYRAALGFEMTASQKRCVREITDDLAGGFRMNRLLQGDVGSGKTAVAGAAAFIAASCGRQAAFTAPTEVLARQHYEKYSRMYASLGYESVLLCASLGSKERSDALEKISSGRARIVFGTHSVFSKDVAYKNLALIIIDEQQRYGVAQRAALEAKADRPHVLVMSATPIPRTLSLSYYRDLDVSVIDEMPAGRKRSFLCGRFGADAGIYGAIRKPRAKRRKASLVCPAIDSEDMENVAATYAQATAALAPYRVEMLTAEMKPGLRAQVMAHFAAGDTHVLIATSVIEVGIDVPHAVIMWVKGSERFGLSQLHQLRGRIGRGAWDSVCFFQTDSSSPEAATRLSARTEPTDGVESAKKDLALRGAGELIGQRQSGKGLDIMQDVMDYEALFTASESIYERLLEKKDKKNERFLLSLKKASEAQLSDIALN